MNHFVSFNLTDLAFPKYFSQSDHRRIYDPLRISNPSITPYLPNTLQIPKGPVTQNLADESGTGTGTGIPSGIGKLADEWSEGSESSPSSPSGIGKLADKWSSGSGSVAGSRSIGKLADKWSSGSSSVAGSHSGIGKLADEWSSGSGSIKGSPAIDKGESQADLALNLADNWSAGSRSAPGSHSSIDKGKGPATAQLADAWSDDDEDGGAELQVDSDENSENAESLREEDREKSGHMGLNIFLSSKRVCLRIHQMTNINILVHVV
jgi:hypothetical protein